MKYALYIGRYRRNINFDTLEDLVAELKEYFTQSEIKSGVVERLTKFAMKTISENGFAYKYGENNYQDMKITCYEF